jgi:ribosomal protein S18 acetylase RimI-like enzyme
MTSTTAPSISKVATPDSERAVATIVTAFSGDPITRWALPEPQQYLQYAPELVRRFCGKSFEGNSALAVEGFIGAALWLKPGVEPDGDAMAALMQEAIPEQDQEKIFGFFGQMAEYHPHEPLWYLPMIGVDPARQGMGLGGALLSHALGEIDREGKAAYLEATSTRSRDLYARHGFEVLGTIQVADSPPMFPMLRKAR